MLNKNTLGVKKSARPIRSSIVNVCKKNFEAKKLLINFLNDIQHVFTTMIGFVTCPPFSHHHYYIGSQVTKPIIVVKTCYKLLYVIKKLISNF